MSEIETSQPGEIITPAVFGQLSIADLLANATHVVDQAQLERDKALLLGIPHVITRLTYRPGVEDKDYVSIEAVVGSVAMLQDAVRRGRVPNCTTLDDLPFRPEEHVVYNDGSTGARRQVTWMMHQSGTITIGDYDPSDMSCFDQPYTEWNAYTQVGYMNGDDGEKVEVPDIQYSADGTRPLSIVVSHGLRVSIEPKFNKPVFYLS